MTDDNVDPTLLTEEDMQLLTAALAMPPERLEALMQLFLFFRDGFSTES